MWRYITILILAVTAANAAWGTNVLNNRYDRDNTPVDQYIAGYPPPTYNPAPPNAQERQVINMIAQFLGVLPAHHVVYRHPSQWLPIPHPYNPSWNFLFTEVHDICSIGPYSNYAIGCTRGYTLRSNVILMVHLDDAGQAAANADTQYNVNTGAYPTASLQWIVPRCQQYNMHRFASIDLWESMRARLGWSTAQVHERHGPKWQEFVTLYGATLNTLNAQIGC